MKLTKADKQKILRAAKKSFQDPGRETCSILDPCRNCMWSSLARKYQQFHNDFYDGTYNLLDLSRPERYFVRPLLLLMFMEAGDSV